MYLPAAVMRQMRNFNTIVRSTRRTPANRISGRIPQTSRILHSDVSSHKTGAVQTALSIVSLFLLRKLNERINCSLTSVLDRYISDFSELSLIGSITTT